MTQEEKAKVYTELINRLEDVKNAIKKQNYGIAMDILCKPYPEYQITTSTELKESEDERIRKALLEMVHDTTGDSLWVDYNVHKEDAIAWLEKQTEHANFRNKIQIGDKVTRNEDGVLVNLLQLNRVAKKQGEQKPADKVEPKFKVGDSISKKHNSDINKFGIFTITSIADNKYWYNDSVICNFSDKDLWEFIERPKFKKGDWVFHNTAEFIYMIQTIGRDGYGVISRDGKKSEVYYSAEINYRLWTIQDAKDGDVLVSESNCGLGTWYCIFKSLDGDESMTVHCYLARDGRFETKKELCFDKDPFNTKPATKEQRDILFQKIREAGYEWDVEKKELRKIEHRFAELSVFDYRTWQYIVSDVLTKKDGIGQYLDDGECKKIAKYMQEEWSKRLSVEQRTTELPKGEDYGIDGLYAAIDILQKTLGDVDGYQSDDGILEHKCAISAVKKLYEQKPAWSEEDEDMLKIVIKSCEQCGNEYAYYWLKSLKERVQLQPKQEWSEKDKVILGKCLDAVSGYYSPEYKQSMKDWLNSLKDRYTWKPTENQIMCLQDTVSDYHRRGYKAETLESRLNQLKQL